MCWVGLAEKEIYLCTGAQQQPVVEAAFSLKPVSLQNHLKRRTTTCALSSDLSCVLSGALSSILSRGG